MKRMFLLFYLLVLSVFDWREKKVPAALLLAGVMIAGGFGLYNCMLGVEDLARSIIELCFGLLPGLFLLLLAWLTRKIGYGDGVVMLTAGLLLGYRSCIALLCFSMLLAALISIVLLALRRANRHTVLPYLPFVTAVYLAGMLI